MSKIKLSMVALLVWFVALSQIDLLLDNLALDPFVFIYVIGMIVIMFLFPVLGKQDLILSTFVVQSLHAFTYGFSTLTIGSGDITLFFINVVIVQVTLMLMRSITSPLFDFNTAAETFLLGSNNLRILPRTEGEQVINHELYRARRFERPFTVIYCRLPEETLEATDDVIQSNNVNWHISKDFKRRYQHMQLAKLIMSLTYKSDVIIEQGDSLIIGLPETEAEQARLFVNQLGILVTDTLGINPIIGKAHFPDEGLIYDNLASEAENTATLWDDHSKGHTEARNGDVLVEIEERMRIEEKAEWVNKMPVPSPTTRRNYRVMKRAFDVVVICLALPVILPVMGIIALLIFLNDGDEIFYMQGRTGYGGHRFQMYKFRTMHVNAVAVPATKVVMSDGSVRYIWPEKIEEDPRITRIGRFLRKTSLDELPQLLNVLKGDMSLVGPRPTTWMLDKYTTHQTERLAVPPGITGLWQISARDATNFDERLLWDMKYIDKANLWMDIVIIWRTVTQVFNKGGV
jgi:lipopolysaccharide/colanic/teichoic acid biosynthesis glycosyltransferase